MAQMHLSDPYQMKSKGKLVTGSRLRFSWGDEVQLESCATADRGMIWRPNLALAERTNGETTHQRYADVYRLLRAGLHIRDQYGARHSDESSEMGQVTSDIEQARRVVGVILDLHACSASERAMYLDLQRELALRYATKLDQEKLTSAERFMRALTAFEALMRPETERPKLSSSQVGMIAGSGIHHLQVRLKTLESIARQMDYRTGRVYGLIQSCMALYRGVWSILREPSFHLKSVERRISLSAQLRTFCRAAHAIRFRPFEANARCVLISCTVIEDALVNGDDAAALSALNALRQEIRWIFVLDAIQREIVIPMSQALEYQGRLLKSRRDRANLIESDRLRFRQCLETMPKRLIACSDTDEAKPVKAAIGQQLAMSIARFDTQDWRGCVAALDAISDILSALLTLPRPGFLSGFFVFPPFR